jgi:nucleotide-binding universal stress UspA family protein
MVPARITDKAEVMNRSSRKTSRCAHVIAARGGTSRDQNRSAREISARDREENEMRPASRRILLATDGSEEAELATRAAVALAEGTGSELHVVHVTLIPITLPYPEVLDWREDLEYVEGKARELLDEQVKKVEDAGGTVARVHLRKGQPAEEIIALAEELGANLIVVGNRHRGRIRRALAGSVSDWVVRHARCPVLVVGAGARVADNRARLSRGTWTARSEASKKASARR